MVIPQQMQSSIAMLDACSSLRQEDTFEICAFSLIAAKGTFSTFLISDLSVAKEQSASVTAHQPNFSSFKALHENEAIYIPLISFVAFNYM